VHRCLVFGFCSPQIVTSSPYVQLEHNVRYPTHIKIENVGLLVDFVAHGGDDIYFHFTEGRILNTYRFENLKYCVQKNCSSSLITEGLFSKYTETRGLRRLYCNGIKAW
jgi:hypothetical protein